jgi:hypothetical protein
MSILDIDEDLFSGGTSIVHGRMEETPRGIKRAGNGRNDARLDLSSRAHGHVHMRVGVGFTPRVRSLPVRSWYHSLGDAVMQIKRGSFMHDLLLNQFNPIQINHGGPADRSDMHMPDDDA